MGSAKGAAEKYWVTYYLVYVVCVGLGLWQYPPWLALGNDVLYLLAAIVGASAGIALLVAIFTEVTARMVLLIPDAIRKIKAEERKRIIDALAKAGVRAGDSDAVLTPSEILKIVQGDSDERS